VGSEQQFDRLVDEAWEGMLEREPLVGTFVGDERYDDRLADPSEAGRAAEEAAMRRGLEQLAALDRPFAGVVVAFPIGRYPAPTERGRLLDLPADELERRISERTDDMVQRGVVEEAREATQRGLSRTAAQALGLDEFAHLPLDEARDRVVLRTRRYAAYQRKWMRRIPGIVLVDADRSTEQVVDAIIDLARSR